jgi:superfamily I DNA and/or RNA helicase
MLDKVKVTVVDNFQGEENDIILISLVRSNSEAKTGFLKIENRVCVALSRAKMGFYIIGKY